MKKILKLNIKLNFLIMLFIIIKTFSLYLHTFSYTFILKFLGESNSNYQNFVFWLVIMILSFIIHIIFNFLTEIFIIKTKEKTISKLHKIQAKKLSNYSYEEFAFNNHGFLSWFNNDVNQNIDSLDQFYSLINGLCKFFMVFFFIIFVSFNTWILIITILFMMLIFVILQKITNNYLSAILKNIMYENQKFANKQIQIFSWFNFLFIQNKIDLFIKKSVEQTKNIYDYEYKMTRKKLNIQIGMTTLFFILSTILVIELILLINYDYLSIFSFLTLFSYTQNLLQNGVQSIFSFFIIKHYKPIWEKTFSHSISDKKDNNTIFSFNEIQKIEVKNLNFSYSDIQILNNVNLKFEKGKKYVIIAKSGKGKSTLLKILIGAIKQYQGSILINEKTELKNIDNIWFKNQISLVNNENFIFNDTLKNNITLYDEKYSDQQINKIINELNIKFKELNKSMNINELSEGEKQKINLARLMLINSPIWMLDEAMDNIHKKDALEIYKKFLNLKDKTMIFVTHHLLEEIKEDFDEIIEL